MTRGSLRVFDNPLSLKAARSSGYRLTIRTTDNDAATSRLIDWLRANAPRAADQADPLSQGLTVFRGLVSFALPTIIAAPAPASAPLLEPVEKEEKKSKKKRKAKERAVNLPVEPIAAAAAPSGLAAFFALLESQREALEIETMQISMGTLEEVFIRTVGGDEEQAKLEKKQQKKKKNKRCGCLSKGGDSV